MCLKPQPARPMPEETGRIGAALLDAASPYRFIGDTLYVQFADEEFASIPMTVSRPFRQSSSRL
jgi:hypothetical protein